MALNWDDLKILLAVSRAGSLSGAALQLGIDQATASRRLAALEADLGAILFARARTGLSPTEAGEAAIARAMEIEARTLRLPEEVANTGQGAAGLVRIIGNPWTLMRLSEHGLPDLLRAHPQIDIRTIGTFQTRSVARGETAIALWFELPPSDTAFAIKLGDVPYAIYAPAGADPEKLGWVSFWDDDAPRRAPIRWIEKVRKPGESLRVTATDSSVLLGAIRAGLGKGLLPMCLAEGDRRLARVTPGPPDLVRALHLHAHPDTVQTARIQAVIAWLRDCFPRVYSVQGAAAAA
jgi:DNA-binding transcriptional LysR family regulator